MTTCERIQLYVRTLWELARYDVLFAWGGMRAVRPPQMARCEAGKQDMENAICETLRNIAPVYWKPIRCLQRSIVTARLMRNRGIAAEVVIGYRPSPFFSHAWVEVGGRVVNDSPAYKMRLQVLERL